jgi:transketolase
VTEQLTDIALRIRKHIVALAADSPGAHVGGSMSATEILTSLYFGGVLNVDPANPGWKERDYLIFSKGHSSAALYAALAEKGFFPVEELKTYKQPGSRLPGHPSRTVPGVELSTGSLGHVLPVAVGLAMGMKHDGDPNRVFVVLGDGECQEGSIWEAAMSAAHYGLDNLVAIVDRNGFQEDGPTEDVMAIEPFADKWRAFGWAVIGVDGHDVNSVTEALRHIDHWRAAGRPAVLIARTSKGHGLSFTSNTHTWHYGKFTAEQRAQAMEELELEAVAAS